jgi:uncharacterized DUF497 family protein
MARCQSRAQPASPRCELRVGENGIQGSVRHRTPDDREDYGEERYVTIGMAEGHVLLFVAYTEREGRIRIISAREVTQHEQDDYFRQNA